jgi:E3 ubiquitin-protein ligase HUWE1
MLVPCLVGRLNVLEGGLPTAMKTVFRNPSKYGGSVYSLFVSVMTTIIHNEPAAFNALNNTGIPGAFLESISNKELLPSSSAILAVPTALSAICLNEEARSKVVELNVIASLFNVFTLPNYVKPLLKSNVNIGGAVDDLVRHNAQLAPKAIESCLKMLNDLIALGNEKPENDKARETLSDMVFNVSKVTRYHKL